MPPRAPPPGAAPGSRSRNRDRELVAVAPSTAGSSEARHGRQGRQRSVAASGGRTRSAAPAIAAASSAIRCRTRRRPAQTSPPAARSRPAGDEQRRSGSDEGKADRDLEQREKPGAREIGLEAHGLVDRHLQRRMPRAAAERQHDREAGEAEEEDQSGDAGASRSRTGRSTKRKIAPGRMPSCAASRQCSPGTAASAREEDARGERRVEEDMRDQDARQPVDPGAELDADERGPPPRSSRSGRAPRRCRTRRRSPAARSRDSARR